jgi:hypothetical protein
MTSDISAQLKAELEALIAEANAKGSGKPAKTEAERDALFRAGKRDRYGR